ncbi:DUF3349 domain-containing protein [Brachybacterium hainanense]|uniref:DUF3349 domain-containing protein n=1 Tax=Brachybacterium hainanense TaxID=1541174 RepID=A0ABV6RAL4_9MICO
MANPLSAVLDWLHAGYPDGVPPHDFYPLLALLTRTLQPQELDEIVATLIRENPDGDICPEDVHQAIERLKEATVAPEDVRAVAARLAAVGWPLSEAPDDRQLADVAENAAADLPEPPNLVQRIIAWLTEGYPEGIPPTDRLPLLALLRRRLTDEEVAQVASRLVDDARASRRIDPIDAGTLITRYTDTLPSESDMARLASHLAAKGWPLRAGR